MPSNWSVKSNQVSKFKGACAKVVPKEILLIGWKFQLNIDAAKHPPLLKKKNEIVTFPKFLTENMTSLHVLKVNLEMQAYSDQHQTHKMVKHTQTIRRQIADELFECV